MIFKQSEGFIIELSQAFCKYPSFRVSSIGLNDHYGKFSMNDIVESEYEEPVELDNERAIYLALSHNDGKEVKPIYKHISGIILGNTPEDNNVLFTLASNTFLGMPQIGDPMADDLNSTSQLRLHWLSSRRRLNLLSEDEELELQALVFPYSWYH